MSRIAGTALALAASLATRASRTPGSWLMHHTWRQLLFAHWPVPVQALQRALPETVLVDTFEGHAYVSVVSFRIHDVHLRGWPPVPGLTDFPEVNLRTYVKIDGEPGVWFLSLRCPDRLAMAVARPWFLLPYEHANLLVETAGEVTTCLSPIFQAEYCPIGPPALAAPDSLDAWLTERYCYFTRDLRGVLYRCQIDHQPWP